VEHWRVIVDHERYEVSDKGRVRHIRTGRYLKARPDWGGYLTVNLVFGSGRKKTRKIHRLVARAFCGDPPTPEHQVAHNDGVKTNNEHLNLRWATVTENNRDKQKHGTQARGGDLPWSKLSEQQVRDIRKCAENGISQKSIANIYGISKGNVQFIVHRKIWTHIQ
jgi:hypothetical protein